MRFLATWIWKWWRPLQADAPVPVTAATLREQLRAAHEDRAAMLCLRDLVALDAVDDPQSAARWNHLNDAILALDTQSQMLGAALAAADVREATAAREAEERRQAQALADFERRTTEERAWLNAVLAGLPNGETLTRARDIRDQLAAAARDLLPSDRSVRVRRPLDPLREIVDAIQHRLDRIDRARWVGRTHPITLTETEGGEQHECSNA